MTLSFRYHVPAGLRLTTQAGSHLLYPAEDGTLRAVDPQTGHQEIWTLKEYLHRAGQPGASQSDLAVKANPALARIRLGGLFHRDQLSEAQRDQLDFLTALCHGVDALHRAGVKIGAATLDRPEGSASVREVASRFYTTRPIGRPRRGGTCANIAIPPNGRTLAKYWRRFVASGYDEMVLVQHTWLQGNRKARLPARAHELIAQAIEDVGLDTKKPCAGAVARRLKDLLILENVRREANGLEPLAAVSYKTVSKHMQAVGATALAIARDGLRATTNDRSRSSTDFQALMIGELVEIDECKLSLITIVRKIGLWQRLSQEDLAALDEIEDYVRTRLYLVLVLDVASRMPLGWVLTDAPSHEATLEALRMATRSKAREKVIYGCDLDPMPPVGIASLRNDNGPGLRNRQVKTALMGCVAQSIDVRAYHSGDKPYVERMFGTTEVRLFNLIHGYTGRKAGHLKGYDAIKNAAYIREELYAMITKYLIDEYPSEVHYGATFFNQRPIKAAERLARDGWAIVPIAPQDRRLHLGWRREATITDEGVKAFGLPYNSPALQRFRDSKKRKVAVYVDPDCINDATVVVEGHAEYIHAELSWTGMRDMSLPEFLAHAEAVRADDPGETRNFDLRMARMRQERFEELRRRAIECDLPRSYMTIEEAQAKADMLMAGMQRATPQPMPGTVAPGMIGRLGQVDDGMIEIEASTADEEPGLFARPNTEGKLK